MALYVTGISIPEVHPNPTSRGAASVAPPPTRVRINAGLFNLSAARGFGASRSRLAISSSRIRPASDEETSRNGQMHRSIEVAGQALDSGISAGSEIGPENTLKVETRVQIPLGLRRSEGMSRVPLGQWPRIGPAAYTGPSRLKQSAVVRSRLNDPDSRWNVGHAELGYIVGLGAAGADRRR